ncbi:hypothetical protein VST63_23140 [Mycolicibacterium sp. 050232]|uniref:hypothetical protein n=1 Tax=Mycolicibacterium sp. 050232 TaxID=3113982 RepID=UPI002E2D3C1F|nr:hypothetical protein [Mycolicibacterium sp. 050232]MED5815266.1 hypothetical protein [Mycolicibacterium sp. 050232]
MGETIEVNNAGLHQLASAHDTAATALSGTAVPPVAASPVWAATSAVSTGHRLVAAASTTRAKRSRATGTKVRAASGSYSSTDEGSAEHVAEVGQTLQV